MGVRTARVQRPADHCGVASHVEGDGDGLGSVAEPTLLARQWTTVMALHDLPALDHETPDEELSGLVNERVKVLRVRIEPHGAIPMHVIPPHVTVWLTDAHMEIVFADGRHEVHHSRAGDVTWVAVGKHSGRNLGDDPIEFIAVEPLDAE